MKRRIAALLLVAGGVAHAGGMYLPLRGVRATGRGGAFVAGADDPQALWYNPAGLAALAGGDDRFELLVDAALVGHDLSYARIDSGGNHLAPVTSDVQLEPLPTIAAEVDLGSRLALGFGLLAPYSALDGFPADGPQRYMMVDDHNTVLAILEVGLALQLGDRLRLGVGVQDMIVHFSSRMVFSACPGQLTCAPEDPEFDALGDIGGTSYWSPSAVFGAQLRAAPWLTLGAALQLPFPVSVDGTVHVRLPSSGFFNGATVSGDRAQVSTTMPGMVRAGVEIAPSPRLRIEAGFDLELWSQQQDIRVVPDNVHVENAAGVGRYDLGPIDLVRNFDDTLALRLGVEGQVSPSLTLRAGFVHESGAAPNPYLSIFTVDTVKNVLTIGAGWRAGRLRLDATYGHVFMADADVAQGTSCVPIIDPIRTGATTTTCVHDDTHTYVGDGTYTSAWNIFGLGATVDF